MNYYPSCAGGVITVVILCVCPSDTALVARELITAVSNMVPTESARYFEGFKVMDFAKSALFKSYGFIYIPLRLAWTYMKYFTRIQMP